MIAAGLADRYLETPDPDRTKIRGAVRQLMVAISAGVLPLCPHVQQIRPQILLCDPPAVVCTECFPSRRAVIVTVGHLSGGFELPQSRVIVHVEADVIDETADVS